MGILIMAQHQAGNLALLGRNPEAAAANLVGRLVEALPLELRRFARESALLGSCTAAEADAILGRADGEERLADLLRAGLFLERHGIGATATYRYQDLLAEVLVADLRAADPARLQTLARAAYAHHVGDPPPCAHLRPRHQRSRIPARYARRATCSAEAKRGVGDDPGHRRRNPTGRAELRVT